MRNSAPRVSIGLPVFNGEAYLEQALDAILAQTFTDFELIISDNASTDRTRQICMEYAARDERIHYYRHEKNLGAARNFNRVFELSTGEYFKWAAHDDLMAPDFLIKCVQVLDADPSVVLCHSNVRFIDQLGKFLADYEIKLGKVSSPRASDRFGELILMHHWCFHVFGLIRRAVLENTSLIASHIGSDRNMLVALALLGRFYDIPEYLFFSRDHPERSLKAMSLHSRAAWFDTSKAGRPVFPRWRIYFEYCRSLGRMSLGSRERLGCYLHLGNWLRLYGKGLVKDLMIALYQTLQFNSSSMSGSETRVLGENLVSKLREHK